MGSMSIAHWLIVLAIIMLVFGTKKIGSMGSDLGKAIKGFNDGVKGVDGEETSPHQHSGDPTGHGHASSVGHKNN